MATPMDGNQESEGTQEQPTSEVSQPTGQLSQAEIEAIIDARTETFRKQFQKGVDKQVGNVRDDVKRILELQEKGLDAAQIERELRIDQFLQGQSAPAEPVPGRTEQSAGFDVNAVVQQLNLNGNDPLVAAYKVAYANDPKGLLEKLTGLSGQAQKPTSATALPPEGGTPTPGQKSVDELTQDYITNMKAAKGNPTRIRQLREQAVKDGVKTWEIDFS